MTTKPACCKTNGCKSSVELLDLMAAMIWKVRHHLPALLIEIKPADREAFAQSLEYNEQTCKVNIEDRNGTTLIHLTDAKTGDQIIATENNVEDLEKAKGKTTKIALRARATELAQAVRGGIASGNFSESEILEACATLETLARA